MIDMRVSGSARRRSSHARCPTGSIGRGSSERARTSGSPFHVPLTRSAGAFDVPVQPACTVELASNDRVTVAGRTRHVHGYLEDFLFPPAAW